MKLLLGQNLSSRLVNHLTGIYPGISHVSLVGLDRASDVAVWEYVQANDYLIVTKDSDFNDLSVMRGSPPKVLWLRLGNCTTHTVEQVLRRAITQVTAFAADNTSDIIALI